MSIGRPAPVFTAWSAAFWDGLREGRLLLQQCRGCRRLTGYPKVFCPHCYSDDVDWVESTGRGSIYTFSTVISNPPSAFLDELPYTIAIVDLEEGVRFLTRLIGVDPGDVCCGLAVRLRIVDDGSGPMPCFEPAATDP